MKTTDECDIPITVSVPEFGEIALGLNKFGSYEAAKTKRDKYTGRLKEASIMVVEVQGKKRVPVRANLATLAGGDPQILTALIADFAAKFAQMKAKQAA